jgi:hypothetical protein
MENGIMGWVLMPCMLYIIIQKDKRPSELVTVL